MGCDIHVIIERRDNGGPWVRVPFATVPYVERGTADSWWKEFDEAIAAGAVAMPDQFTSRNYSLFGILADVRNGFGFAGIPTGEPWTAIAPDRGLPADMVPLANPYELGDHLGDHSFTWIGLDELRAFDWDGTVRRKRGVVEFPVWREWQDSQDTQPTEWAGGVSGRSVEIITAAQALERSTNLHDNLYVESEWSTTAREATGDWPGQIIPILERIANGGELRLLMGFDS